MGARPKNRRSEKPTIHVDPPRQSRASKKFLNKISLQNIVAFAQKSVPGFCPETQHTRADRARESDEALTERRDEVATDSESFIQGTMTSAEAAAEAHRVSDRAQTAGIEKSKDAPEFADADRDARTTPTSAHATGVKAREGQVESSDSDSNQDGERNGVKHGDEGRRHGEGAKKVSLCSRTTTRHNARKIPTLPNPEHARPPRCDVVIDAFVDPDESTRLSWVWIRSERGRRTSTARQPSAFPAARLPSCFSLVGSERFGRARYFHPRDGTEN